MLLTTVTSQLRRAGYCAQLFCCRCIAFYLASRLKLKGLNFAPQNSCRHRFGRFRPACHINYVGPFQACRLSQDGRFWKRHLLTCYHSSRRDFYGSGPRVWSFCLNLWLSNNMELICVMCDVDCLLGLDANSNSIDRNICEALWWN